MPLEREQYEGLLNELLTPDLEAGRKTEILTSLRDHNLEYTTSYETLNKEKDKLSKDNADLVVANSKLFRQTGVVKEEEPKKDEAKEFSQKITLEAIESKLKNK